MVQRTAVLIVLLWTLCVGVCHADYASEALELVSKCSTISDPAERLKCFDRAAPVAKEAQVPNVADFGKPTPPPVEVAQVVATVKELSKTVRGKVIFVLDNGQVWRQIDGDDTNVPELGSGA